MDSQNGLIYNLPITDSPTGYDYFRRCGPISVGVGGRGAWTILKIKVKENGVVEINGNVQK